MRKGKSPRLDITITDENREHAIDSNSGGCLIADAIKSQYPHLSGVVVDMATIRVTDRDRGERYTYLTPPAAQHVLLSFDQGWVNPVNELTVKTAVKITKITRGNHKRDVARQQELQVLAQKRDAGEELTSAQRRRLSQSETAKKKVPVDRPTSVGPVTDVIDRQNDVATVVGGPPLPQGPAHPNLLRGRNRIFGAKLADPGRAFDEAVQQRVAEELEKQTG
jgi:hypothetical protein